MLFSVRAEKIFRNPGIIRTRTGHMGTSARRHVGRESVVERRLNLAADHKRQCGLVSRGDNNVIITGTSFNPISESTEVLHLPLL